MIKGIFFVLLLILCIGLFADWDMVWFKENEFALPITNYAVFGQNVETGNSGAY